MGHWSTYSRRGGGPPTAVELIEMLTAELVPSLMIRVSYSGPVNDFEFSLFDFGTEPNGWEPVDITGFPPDVLELTFVDDLSAETDLTYDGPVPGVLTPQTIP